MKNIKFFKVVPFVFLISWMTVIFVMSAQPAEQSSQLSGGIVSRLIAAFFDKFDGMSAEQQLNLTNALTLIVRKTAHFLEYFILGMLSSFAINTLPKVKHKPLFAAAFCVLYAISDEIHQYFVPGRACRFLDICIDSAGSITAVILIFILYKKRLKGSGDSVAKKETD